MTAKQSSRRRARRDAARKAPITRVRKNMDMDPTKLRAAQQALGTKSETETVDRALELAIGRRRIGDLMDRFAERGGLRAYDIHA